MKIYGKMRVPKGESYIGKALKKDEEPLEEALKRGGRKARRVFPYPCLECLYFIIGIPDKVVDPFEK